jgi:hypothetical protein
LNVVRPNVVGVEGIKRVIENETELVWVESVESNYATPTEDCSDSDPSEEGEKCEPPGETGGGIGIGEPWFVGGSEFGGECGGGQGWF